MLGQYRLRVKLHALDLQRLVPQPHHEPVGRLGGYFECIGQTVTLDDQAVITSGCEIIWNAGENGFTVVNDLDWFSVNRLRCTLHLAAKMLADRLMAETYAEDW